MVVLPLVLAGGVLLWLGSKSNVNSKNTTYPSTWSASPKSKSGYPGISRPDMQLIQYELAWLGYYHGGIHGIFDPDTKDAIIGFQNDHGLIPDGLPGRDTWELLDLVSAAAP